MTAKYAAIWLWIIACLVLLFVVIATSHAHAADASVCKPYATQLLDNQMRWLWDRAFNHCLNLEDENPVPPAPGDWKGTLDILVPDHTPIAQLGVAPATEKPSSLVVVRPPPPPAKAAVARSSVTAATTCSRVHKRIVWKGKSWRCV